MKIMVVPEMLTLTLLACPNRNGCDRPTCNCATCSEEYTATTSTFLSFILCCPILLSKI